MIKLSGSIEIDMHCDGDQATLSRLYTSNYIKLLIIKVWRRGIYHKFCYRGYDTMDTPQWKFTMVRYRDSDSYEVFRAKAWYSTGLWRA